MTRFAFLASSTSSLSLVDDEMGLAQERDARRVGPTVTRDVEPGRRVVDPGLQPPRPDPAGLGIDRELLDELGAVLVERHVAARRLSVAAEGLDVERVALLFLDETDRRARPDRAGGVGRDDEAGVAADTGCVVCVCCDGHVGAATGWHRHLAVRQGGELGKGLAVGTRDLVSERERHRRCRRRSCT